jgi:hypothetical protein
VAEVVTADVNDFNAIEGRVRWGALRRGNQGGALRLQLDVFEVRSWAVGQSEAARFSGDVVSLR